MQTYTYDDKYIYFRDVFPKPQKSISGASWSDEMTARVEDDELPEWATGLFLLAWGGSSSSNTQSRNAYVASYFPNHRRVQTIRDFVELVIRRGRVGHARQHCPDGFTDNVEREIRRQRE